MKELKKLINMITEQYEIINSEWLNNHKKINMRKLRVSNIYNNQDFLSYVHEYREFVDSKIDLLTDKIVVSGFENKTYTRIKTSNSVEYKLYNYMKNHENGKIPVNKCLNDLFGIRMIFNKNVTYDEINEFIKNNFSKLKCIKSIKKDYNAIHIYFGNDNNYYFEWELQIWDVLHEESNLVSHNKYKQDYIIWENNKVKGE